MNDVQIFDNPEFGTVRTLMIDDEPWFVGKDVAAALGYSNPKDALTKHVDAEDKIVGSRNATPSIIDDLGRTQYPTWINESGLYSLIFSSKLESANRFKRWVTSEVLPAIRKTGSYTVAEVLPERPITRDDYLAAARILAGCRNERLPMVVTMLDKAGLDMEEVMSVRGAAIEARQDEDPKISDYEMTKLQEILSIYSDAYVAEKAGLYRAQINQYRHGQRVPRRSRYEHIMKAMGFKP